MYVPYRNSYRHASRDFLRMHLVILLKVTKKIPKQKQQKRKNKNESNSNVYQSKKKKDNKQCYNHTRGYFTTLNVNDPHLYKTS